MKCASAYTSLILAVGLLVAGVAPVQPEQQPGAADRFEVSDVMIPMRDGARLHTKIFTPPSPRLRRGRLRESRCRSS